MTEHHHTIEQDGRTLHGDRWTLPEHFVDSDIQEGRLLSLKGITDPGCLELQSPTIHGSSEAWW